MAPRGETVQAPVALHEQHGIMARISGVVENARDKFADIAANVRGSKTVQLMAVAAASGALAVSGCGGEDSPAEVVSRLDKADAEKCGEGSFAKKELDAGEKSRLLKEGLPKTDNTEEARANVDLWLSKVKRDPEIFAGSYSLATDKNLDSTKLFDKEGCSTPYAEKREDKLTVMFSSAKITAAKVPSNATNTGVNQGGELVQASAPGISGNRNGIKIEMLNGKTIYILDRCGNLAEEGNLGLPEGPTDQPPPKKKKGVTPKHDPNDTPAGVPGHNGGTRDTAETTQPKPGSSPDGTGQTQKPKPAPIPQPQDTRPDANGNKPPAEEGTVDPVTEPPVNDSGSADQDKTTDPGEWE